MHITPALFSFPPYLTGPPTIIFYIGLVQGREELCEDIPVDGLHVACKLLENPDLFVLRQLISKARRCVFA